MRRLFKALLFFSLLLAAHISWAAQDQSALLVAAGAEYGKGNYQEAARQYLEAIEHGHVNGHVHYNLGNAYYRLGEFGRAIAQYRKALELLPNDPDVLANLELARREAIDRIDEESSIWTDFRRILFIRSLMTEHQMQLVFIALYVLFWGAFVFLPRESNSQRKTLLRGLFAVLLFWSLLTFGSRNDRLGKPTFALTPTARSIQPAVVLAEEAKVFSGNAESFQVVFVLHMGAEVEAAERRDGWVEVLLPNKRRGWVKEEHVEIL